MKKKVTPTVCERIQFIKNRIKEILVDMLPENEKEYGDLLNEFDSIREDYDLFDSVFEENGKTGVVDVTGRIIVPAIYKDCPELFAYTPFESLPMAVCNFEDKDGYLYVCKEGAWGYISRKGEFIDENDEDRMDEEELLCLFEY